MGALMLALILSIAPATLDCYPHSVAVHLTLFPKRSILSRERKTIDAEVIDLGFPVLSGLLVLNL